MVSSVFRAMGGGYLLNRSFQEVDRPRETGGVIEGSFHEWLFSMHWGRAIGAPPVLCQAFSPLEFSSWKEVATIGRGVENNDC